MALKTVRRPRSHSNGRGPVSRPAARQRQLSLLQIHGRGIAQRLKLMPTEKVASSRMQIPLPRGYSLRRVRNYSSFHGEQYSFYLYKKGRKIAEFGNTRNAKAFAEHEAARQQAFSTAGKLAVAGYRRIKKKK